MTPRNTVRSSLVMIAVGIFCALVAACSSGSSNRVAPSTTPPSSSPSPSASTSPSPSPTSGTTQACTAAGPGATTAGGGDVAVPGDIPDSQAFVSYSPPGGNYTVEVPEGWTRTDAPNHAHWQSKLISVDVRIANRASAPTPESARADEVPAIERASQCVKLGAISSVARKSGPTVRIVFQADSAPEPVTGKVVRDDVERYEYWHAGKETIITLAAPVGSDNVDVWRRITDSFTWR